MATEASATNFAKDQLKSFIERIERLEEEKKSIADDIREVYAEAKGTGFDVKALREIIKLRKMDADERREHEAILETYMNALGMLFDTPLGQAATERATDAAGVVKETARTLSLTNPKHMPSAKQIKAAVARAEAR